MHRNPTYRDAAVFRIALSAAGLCLIGQVSLSDPALAASGTGTTTTPIEHIVVIFQENVSFDHYFATYPVALNPQGSRLSSRRRIRPR